MIDLSSSAAHGALADDVSRACDPSMDDALREHASALTQTIEVLLARADETDRVVVDLMDADLAFDVSALDYKDSPIENIRVGKHEDKTRVVFDLSAAVRPRTSGMVVSSTARRYMLSRIEPGRNTDSTNGLRETFCNAPVSRISGSRRSASRAGCCGGLAMPTAIELPLARAARQSFAYRRDNPVFSRPSFVFKTFTAICVRVICIIILSKPAVQFRHGRVL